MTMTKNPNYKTVAVIFPVHMPFVAAWMKFVRDIDRGYLFEKERERERSVHKRFAVRPENWCRCVSQREKCVIVRFRHIFYYTIVWRCCVRWLAWPHFWATILVMNKSKWKDEDEGAAATAATEQAPRWNDEIKFFIRCVRCGARFVRRCENGAVYYFSFVLLCEATFLCIILIWTTHRPANERPANSVLFVIQISALSALRTSLAARNPVWLSTEIHSKWQTQPKKK